MHEIVFGQGEQPKLAPGQPLLRTPRILYTSSREDETRRLFEVLSREFGRATVMGFTERNEVICYMSTEGNTRVSRFRTPISPAQRNLAKYLSHLLMLVGLLWQLVKTKSFCSDITVCTGAIDTTIVAQFKSICTVK